MGKGRVATRVVDVGVDNGREKRRGAVSERDDGRLGPDGIALPVAGVVRVVRLLACGHGNETTHAAGVVGPLADAICYREAFARGAVRAHVDGDRVGHEAFKVAGGVTGGRRRDARVGEDEHLDAIQSAALAAVAGETRLILQWLETGCHVARKLERSSAVGVEGIVRNEAGIWTNLLE